MNSSVVVRVRDLRKHLTVALRQVALGGGVLLIDDDERPIARLIPVEREEDADACRR